MCQRCILYLVYDFWKRIFNTSKNYLFLEPMIAHGNCVLDSWMIKLQSLAERHHMNSRSAEPRVPSLYGNYLAINKMRGMDNSQSRAQVAFVWSDFPGMGTLASFGKCSCPSWLSYIYIAVISHNSFIGTWSPQKSIMDSTEPQLLRHQPPSPEDLPVCEWLCVLCCTYCAFGWPLTWMMGGGRVIY